MLTPEQLSAIRARAEKAHGFGEEVSAEAGAAYLNFEDAMTPGVALALLAHVAALEAENRELRAELNKIASRVAKSDPAD